MENESPAPSDALAALDDARATNTRRLRRPPRYWLMLAAFLSVFALMPYLSPLPALVQFLAPPVLMILIAIFAMRRQPTAVRKIRLSGVMALQLVGLAVLGGAVVGVTRALYAQSGWAWAPAAGALLILAVIPVLGRWMDRSWAERASRF